MEWWLLPRAFSPNRKQLQNPVRARLPVIIAACTDGYVTSCVPCDTSKVVNCVMIMLTSRTYPDHGWLGKEGCRHGTVAFATCVRPFGLRTETCKRLQSIL